MDNYFDFENLSYNEFLRFVGECIDEENGLTSERNEVEDLFEEEDRVYELGEF